MGPSLMVTLHLVEATALQAQRVTERFRERRRSQLSTRSNGTVLIVKTVY